MKVYDIYSYLDKIAPFKNQAHDDNCGLLVGDMNAEVKKILVCLDVTNAVVAEAKEKNIELIIAHHPLMYFGVKNVMSDNPIHGLIRNNINFIAAHTNLDVADGGVTDLMLVRLGVPPSDTVIEVINPDGSGFGKIIDLDIAISPKELAVECKQAFGCTAVRYVDGGSPVKRVGLCSGGGGDLVEIAREKGCDAYICGDLRWDRMVLASNYGMTLIDAGHFHTEDIFCEDLVAWLRTEFPEISVEKAKNSVDVCKYAM